MFLAALLICTENTFWDISKDHDDNFVELFEESFLLYVESGMRERVDAAIYILLRDEQGASGWKVTKEFKEKFGQLVVEHFLRMFIFSICTLQI